MFKSIDFLRFHWKRGNGVGVTQKVGWICKCLKRMQFESSYIWRKRMYRVYWQRLSESAKSNWIPSTNITRKCVWQNANATCKRCIWAGAILTPIIVQTVSKDVWCIFWCCRGSIFSFVICVPHRFSYGNRLYALQSLCSSPRLWIPKTTCFMWYLWCFQFVLVKFSYFSSFLATESLEYFYWISFVFIENGQSRPMK